MLREPLFVELEAVSSWSDLVRSSMGLVGQRRIVVGDCVDGLPGSITAGNDHQRHTYDPRPGATVF